MNLPDLVGRRADERLLSDGDLPVSIGRPAVAPPPSRTRGRIVAAGATLTGLTLLIGIALIAGGIGEAVSNAAVLAVALIAAGAVLVVTHWGWVHVAEATGQAIDRRRDSQVLGRQRQWLEQISPYTRYEVSTQVDHEGSIHIVRARYEPSPTGEGCFTFTRQVELEEVHSAEEPGAAVAERAELLRHEAAADTERERQRYEIAADAYETALLDRNDEQQRRVARRAASEALSAQINAKLRDPPLIE
jgi:membrane protein implicated in regulation of membrane protease activity